MRRRRGHSSFRFLASFALLFSAFFAATTGHVFTAHTAPAGPVGFTSAAGGYAVSNIAYRFDPADPTRLGGVSFDLGAPARSAQVRAGGSEGDCTVTGTRADCTFASPPLLEQLSSLQVAAVS
jgi:hypothetical protein